MNDAFYYDYLCSLVLPNPLSDSSYDLLLSTLNSVDFTWIIAMDENRIFDAYELRRRFAGPSHYRGPCSVLEIMVALATRCEEEYMNDLDYGDRTPLWFWKMIESLGLSEMSDRHFNRPYTLSRINAFLLRRYSYDGNGGLFCVPNPPDDMRKTELWIQMLWHINTIT